MSLKTVDITNFINLPLMFIKLTKLIEAIITIFVKVNFDFITRVIIITTFIMVTENKVIKINEVIITIILFMAIKPNEVTISIMVTKTIMININSILKQ